MTKRSAPTQVLSILPSLPMAPRTALRQPKLRIEGKRDGMAFAWPRRLSGRLRRVGLARGQHRPGDSGRLGRLRHHRHFHQPSGKNALLPFAGPVGARAGVAHEGGSAEGEELAQPPFACRLTPLIRRLPAEKSWRGVMPASRAKAKRCPSPTAATMACAVKNPTPGTVQRRRIVRSALAID